MAATVMPSSSATSASEGSRPSDAPMSRRVRDSRLSFSTWCTGSRTVRLCSAIARPMAWRIHQVA